MPDRFWVGGSGTWNATSTTNWSATSGGAGGASAPTSADDVFFDANSNVGTGAFTVTIAGTSGSPSACRSFSTGGAGGALDGAMTLTFGTSTTLDIHGSLTFPSTNLAISVGGGVSQIRFRSTTTGNTITTNGVVFGSLNLVFNGAGGVWTLGSPLTHTGGNIIDLANGTLNTNGETLTSPNLYRTSAGTFTLNLGSSIINLTGTASTLNVTTPTGFTFNAGSSQINFTSSSPSATITGGLTFNNVEFTSTTIGTTIITGVNTFNNLSFAGPAAVGLVEVQLFDRQTVNGTFSTTGTAGNRRIWFRSANYGIALPLLTINGSTSLTDADFRDVIVTGTAAPISGTRIGDLRGNRGITFSAPKTVFRIGTGNWSANQWSGTSGGAVSTDEFPLAQDIAVFNNSTSGGTHALDGAMGYIGTIDMSARTNALTISFSSDTTVYGNWTNGSGITLSGTANLTFSGRNTQTITGAGRTFSCPITIDTFGGIVELSGTLVSTNAITVTNGTFDTKGVIVTATQLSSSGSGVRTITLGSSQLNLSAVTALDFTTSTNLTFNAGSSSISCTYADSLGVNFFGGGMTFNDVTITNSNNSAVKEITGSNTFNTLTLAAPINAGLSEITFAANQTINNLNLNIAGGGPIFRCFARSNTIGTVRTLTVGTLLASDCDFRDITIAGAAAGSSPTRAGDCGGNSGITFPAPKTVYRSGGLGNWSSNFWASSSTGTPDILLFPLAQDTALFTNSSGSGTITPQRYNVGSVDMSARTTAFNIGAITGGLNYYGNWILSSAATYSSASTAAMVYCGRGVSTFTGAGVGITQSLDIDCVTGTLQLGSALSITSTPATVVPLDLISGTFDAATYNVTTYRFEATGTSSTLKMGSGTWTIFGDGSAWTVGSNLGNFDAGTANILLSDNTTASRTFAGGGFSYNKLTIGGSTSTSTTTITGINQFTELASTKTVAHTISIGSGQAFGAWTVTGSAGNVVTISGGSGHFLVGACTSGIDYLAMGIVGFNGSSPGEFYAGPNSTGTAGAPVYRTAKPADSVRYWVGGTGNWSDTARWSESSGGAGGASVPRSHDDVVFNSASNATAYTATVNTVTGGIRCKSLTIAGPASDNLTLAGTATMIIHNNVTLPATGLTRTYTGNIILTGSTTGRTFTTNGVVLNSTITIDGEGCEWLLGSDLNNGTSSISVSTGTFDLANRNLIAGALLSSLALSSNFTNFNSRTIKLGNGTLTLSATTAVNLGGTSASSGNRLTFNAGASQINCSATSAGITGNGKTFHNVSLTSTARVTSSIAGTSTGATAPTVFNNLTIAGRASAGVGTLIVDVPRIMVVNGTLTVSAGTDATCRTFIQSGTIGTTSTITCAAFSGTDVDFRDITITGAAAPASGTRLGDCKGNSGITFPAPKTVYWNLAVGGVWASTAWATSSGGTPAVNNFPLAQDTGVFETTGLNSGASVSFNASYNIGTVDMSARTTDTMTLSISTAPVIYGNWINGTGTTLSGGGTSLFAGRGSQTITSAGRTFSTAVTINSPAGSVTLQDSFSSGSGMTLVAGTFNAAIYNVTVASFTSTGSSTRTLTMGSGTWTLSTSGTVWNVAASGLTLTGSGTISATSGSAKTFSGAGINYSGITLNQGGAGTLTISGNNTFRDITATHTATSATAISLGTTTQRLTQFTGKGEATRLFTIQGTSAASPATIIYTGAGPATDTTVDYLSILGVRAHPLTSTWYAGTNSVNSGTLGWDFTASPAPPPQASGGFFMIL